MTCVSQVSRGSVRDMEEIPEMLTTREVADLFKVDPRTIRRWGMGGQLTYYRPTGGKLLYPSDQFHIQQAIRLNGGFLVSEPAEENSVEVEDPD